MTTLLISEVFPPRVGGSARWLWDIFSRLPREQVAVAAGTCDGDVEFDRTHDLRLTRIRLDFESWGIFGVRAVANYWKRYRQVSNIVKRERVQSVIGARMLPEGLLALGIRKRYGLQFACFVHGEELNYASGSRELSFLASAVLRRAETLIANSRNTARILIERWAIPESKIHLLYPGIDTSTFVPAKRDPTTRMGLGWGDRPVILTTGRLQKRKGQDMMIRALPAICRSIPNVLYAVVGDGEERESLRTLANELNVAGHVCFHGAMSDSRLLACLQQCDLFALPNRQVGHDIEGFGIVLIEAQACGKPVIVGDSGGTAETLEPGRTGAVLDCTNPDALPATVTDLLRDPDRLESMGRAAREWAVEQFDWSRLMERATDLIINAKAEPALVG